MIDLDEGFTLLAEAENPPPWETECQYDKSTRCAGIWPVGDRRDEIVTTDSGVYGPDMADARLLVWAVNNLPRLLAELRRLRREVGP